MWLIQYRDTHMMHLIFGIICNYTYTKHILDTTYSLKD